jgi:23S rRNA (uracil1939-C5)-methyltransferase
MPDTFINIKSLDMDARGVGHLENEDGSQGKVVFVEGALPGERVSYEVTRKKKNWEAGRMRTLQKASSMRVEPKCPHFGHCGGCSMQHLEPSAQVAMKQRVLEDNLKHIGKTKAEHIMRPMYGPTWAYRYRARLSVRWVAKREVVLVGFHERHSSFVAHMTSCQIVPKHISDMLVPLRELIRALSIYQQVPQIEVAVGEESTVLVLRIMAPLSRADETLLRAFADRWNIEWWLQPKGPETAAPFYPLGRELYYTLPEFGIRMPFKPTDFTQVNHQINRLLVHKALGLLDVQKDERVADLFCGLGNFTLPLATQAREVVGIEGSSALTTRALENARANGLAGKTTFYTRNLFEITSGDLVALGRFDRMLIDPPRDGAVALAEALAALRLTNPGLMPKRIVYVSCGPATLARDAGILVHRAGYRISRAGVANMFPHTSHVESVAVFDLLDDFVPQEYQAQEVRLEQEQDPQM